VLARIFTTHVDLNQEVVRTIMFHDSNTRMMMATIQTTNSKTTTIADESVFTGNNNRTILLG
jgi:hypothetical protein